VALFLCNECLTTKISRFRMSFSILLFHLF